MKFINYLKSIAGIEIYPLISLIVFFSFFILLSLYLIKIDKKHISHLKNIPLD
jgi:hypothetical protein